MTVFFFSFNSNQNFENKLETELATTLSQNQEQEGLFLNIYFKKESMYDLSL